jgi:SAM-dependent methyltransferase
MILARYDAVADFYVAGFSSADDSVSVALLGLLGPVTGQDVLDVACGHGRLTRELARRGARVRGVDLSGKLLAKAREAEDAERLGIQYVHADVTTPGVVGSAEFDAATCNFGLSDIDDLDGAIVTVSHALRPGGRFVFSILHPCFPGGAPDVEGSWPATGSYYEEGRWTAQGARATLRRQVGASHRTLSTYLNTLRAHHLWLDEVAEPLPRADWDPAHLADRTPVFLVARSVKVTERAD